ncbi:hypothetical protein ACOSQ3_021471 [Xanthoceras sorbifolium]
MAVAIARAVAVAGSDGHRHDHRWSGGRRWSGGSNDGYRKKNQKKKKKLFILQRWPLPSLERWPSLDQRRPSQEVTAVANDGHRWISSSEIQQWL